jgi:hypothetical protein
MNTSHPLLAIAVLLVGTQFGRGDELHTPPAGSAERKEIMDTLRKEYTTGSGAAVKFEVKHLKVHKGWVWVNVVPLDKDGKPEGEEWPSLLNLQQGKWVMIDLMAIAEALDDPVGPMDPSAKFLRAVQKKYPSVPADIFPKARK